MITEEKRKKKLATKVRFETRLSHRKWPKNSIILCKRVIQIKSHSNCSFFFQLAKAPPIGISSFFFFFTKKMKRFPLLLDLTYIQRFQQKISRELSVVTFNFIIFFYPLKPNWISFSIFDFATFIFGSINMSKINVIKVKQFSYLSFLCVVLLWPNEFWSFEF